jgi:hypothetical protein
MLETIKEWKAKLNLVDDDSYKYIKEGIKLKKYVETGKKIHIYKIWGILEKSPGYYKNLFWDIETFKDINKNIIKTMSVLDKTDCSQTLKAIYSFKSKLIHIKNLSRTDVTYLENDNKDYIIYNKLLNLKYNNLYNTRGFSYINLKSVTINNIEKTDLTIIMELNGSLPYFVEMIPGIIVLKCVLNIKMHLPK